MPLFNENLSFTSEEPNIKGFHEAILSVTDLERAVDFYKKTCGWEVIARKEGSSDLKNLWHLDASVEIEEVLMRNPGDIKGFLRIVKFKNEEQVTIRSGAHVWDTGGIFDLNMRAKNVQELFKAFQNEGWNGYGEPHRFTFGKFDVSEVLVKGPHGITFALMQRFAPPLEGYPNLEISSRVFNSTTICEDIEVTNDFFLNKLDFKLYFKTSGLDRSSENVLGIPPSINSTFEVPVQIVHPTGSNIGSIELLEIKKLKGRNCAPLAKPPNLGILMLRFPVANAEAYAETIQVNGVQLNSEIQTLEIMPYGKMKIFSVQTPDGVWLEFMELVKPS